MKIFIIFPLLFGLARGQNVRRRQEASDLVRAEFDVNHENRTFEYDDPNSFLTSTTELVDQRVLLSCPSYPGYVFWPGYDSYQYDLGRYDPTKMSLSSMISSCTSNPSCKGLNTNGYYKSYIQPLRKWGVW